MKSWRMVYSRQFPGAVRPGKRAVLSTRMNGTVQSIEVEAGDSVQRDALLAVIESRDVEAAILAAEEQFFAARTALHQAVKNVNRLERLYREDLIARNRWEEAQVKKRDLEAKVKKAWSELQVQRVNLSYGHISAPFPGTVSEVAVDEGAFVGPGKPLIILEDRSSVRIDVSVPSVIAERLTSKDVFLITGPSIEEPVPAKFVAIIPALEDFAVGQRLRLSLEDPPRTVQPGQVVHVVLRETGPEGAELAAVPEGALIRRGQLTSVMVVDEVNGKHFAHVRWVSTITSEAWEKGFVGVSQGLKAGEHVILDPPEDLKDGQRVSPSKVLLR